jgi:hypothetical protein
MTCEDGDASIGPMLTDIRQKGESLTTIMISYIRKTYSLINKKMLIIIFIMF